MVVAVAVVAQVAVAAAVAGKHHFNPSAQALAEALQKYLERKPKGPSNPRGLTSLAISRRIRDGLLTPQVDPLTPLCSEFQNRGSVINSQNTAH